MNKTNIIIISGLIFFLLSGILQDLYNFVNTPNSCILIGVILLVWGIYEKVFDK